MKVHQQTSLERVTLVLAGFDLYSIPIHIPYVDLFGGSPFEDNWSLKTCENYACVRQCCETKAGFSTRYTKKVDMKYSIHYWSQMDLNSWNSLGTTPDDIGLVLWRFLGRNSCDGTWSHSWPAQKIHACKVNSGGAQQLLRLQFVEDPDKFIFFWETWLKMVELHSDSRFV